MSLEGNLTAFGLSEILQLIAVQQKSGMLSIGTQDRAKVLFFRDGNIISTRDRRRRAKDPLRDYLTRYGVLSREDLARIENIAAASKLDLTEVIVSEGFISEDEMRRHYRNHIQEEVYEILTWEQCSYKFIPGRDLIDGLRTWGEFGIEGMLMESMRRIDEFPAAEKLLPDLNTLVARAGDPEEGQDLTSNEHAIRALLLDGEHPLGHLIANGCMPRYDVYEAVRHLHDKKLVTIELSKEMQEQLQSQQESRKPGRAPRRNPLPMLVAMVVFAAAAMWGGRDIVPIFPQSEPVNVETGDPVTPHSIARNRVEAELRWLLEAYYAEFGRYPETVTILKKSGHVRDGFLESVERYDFRYNLTAGGEKYTLL